MPFKDISIQRYAGHFVQYAEWFVEISEESIVRNISELGHWLRRRCHLKIFLFLALKNCSSCSC